MKRGAPSLHAFIMREAASTGQLKDTPSPAQLRALAAYEREGLTTRALCRTDTFTALVRKGWLRRSRGLGPIEAEITPAGRAVLREAPPSEATPNGLAGKDPPDEPLLPPGSLLRAEE